jgi:hypothetical protein
VHDCLTCSPLCLLLIFPFYNHKLLMSWKGGKRAGEIFFKWSETGSKIFFFVNIDLHTKLCTYIKIGMYVVFENATLKIA